MDSKKNLMMPDESETKQSFLNICVNKSPIKSL